MGGHVLRETTNRGLCGLGCPSRTCYSNYKGVSGLGKKSPSLLNECAIGFGVLRERFQLERENTLLYFESI
jgi:hypothetical protein